MSTNDRLRKVLIRQLGSISLALASLIILFLIPRAAFSRPSSTPAKTVTPTPTMDRWKQIHLWTPYPFTTPLPPRARTSIDGDYVYLDTIHAPSRVPCRRCPPYPPLAGVWKLDLHEGIFRAFHPNTGWRTLGSYTVAGDRVTFFNDPQCHLAVGVFTWQIETNALHMQLVNDDCELGTRGKLFSGGPWRSCQPPNREAAATGHWKMPQGCE